MPMNTTTASYIVNIGAVGIAGAVFGMPFESLLLGAMAGAVVHGISHKTSRKAGLRALMISMLLAGAFSLPLAEFLSLNYAIAATPEREVDILQPLAAVLIGGCWPRLAPSIEAALQSVIAAMLHALGRATPTKEGDHEPR